MKIGIITFQETNNYGAVLQNYALQQTIIKMGVDVETIDYHSRYISKPYKLIHLRNKGLLNYLFGVAGYICYLPRTKKVKKFRQMIKYSPCVDANTIGMLNDRYDKFIAGSDQVWNYKLTGMDTNYMLDFVRDKEKCNGYAASLGLQEIPKEQIYEYKRCLEDFKCISVREKTASNILSNILNREIFVASDPCVLLRKQEWEKVIKPVKIDRPYILVYQLGVSADVVSLAKRIASEQKMKIVFIPFPVGKLTKGKWDISAGPMELISYIHDAAYVITDSFHGTLFSILFNKQFFTKIAGTHASVGARIFDLLDSYKLTDRIVGKDVDSGVKINYNEINRILDKNRDLSFNILRNIVED